MALTLRKDMGTSEPPTTPMRTQNSATIFCLKISFIQWDSYLACDPTTSLLCVSQKTNDVYPSTLGLDCPQLLPSQWTRSKSAMCILWLNKAQVRGTGDIAQQLPGRILWTHLQEVLEKTKALWQSKWVIVTVVGWLQWLCVPQNSKPGLVLTHWDNKTHPSWVVTCIPIWIPFIFSSKQTEPLSSCSRSPLTFLLKQLGHLNLPWCHQRT